MPNVNDIYGGTFLTKEHVTKPTTLTITETSMFEYDDGNRQIVLHFRGTDKKLGLNATNAKFCAEHFDTPDSDKWCGMKVEVYVDPDVMMKGQRVGGVRLRVPGMTPPAATPATRPDAPLASQEEAPFDDDLDNIPW